MAAPMLSGNALVDAIHDACEEGQTRKQVKDVLDSQAYVIQSEIQRGHRARLPLLGTIEVRIRAARKKRKGRNPATGEEVMIPAKPSSTKIGFRPLKDLNEALPTPQKAKRAKG